MITHYRSTNISTHKRTVYKALRRLVFMLQRQFILKVLQLQLRLCFLDLLTGKRQYMNKASVVGYFHWFYPVYFCILKFAIGIYLFPRLEVRLIKFVVIEIMEFCLNERNFH